MTMNARARVLLLFAGVATGAGAAEVQIHAVRPAEIAAIDGQLDAMLADGRLVRRALREDSLLEDRRHERLAQFHRGVPVWGGEVTRQRGERGTVSVFGRLQEGLPDLDVRPGLGADRARTLAGDRLAVPASEPPQLVLYPADDGRTFRLAWRVRVIDGAEVWVTFLDAHTGSELLRYDDFQTQTATVGLGTGVLGDKKKMSVTEGNGRYYASDGLRPPLIVTHDAGGDTTRAVLLINGFIAPGLTDVGSDADNDWTDGALVDAHTYAGWTYDYYFKVHNRRGLDGADAPMRSIVNPARMDDYNRLRNTPLGGFFANAGWTGFAVVYGIGAPVPLSGNTWKNTAGSLDVVAHELTHGVTQYSSGLVYVNEAGALNEAFSDIMSVAAQFFHKSPSANYVVGDDVITPRGIRSMASPQAHSHPDHYSIRYTGTADNGGVHINSAIANHAFYLAIEGGTNRVSGQRVEGVGAAQRVKIERLFFRAFTRMLTPRATFSDARAATLQSARDLYGETDPAVRAVTQAWDAVGVF